MHLSNYSLFNFFFYCTCNIRRFFCKYLFLTIVLAILNNIVYSKSIAVFPTPPHASLFFNILYKQISVARICVTSLMTFIHLRSDYFFPPNFTLQTCFPCSRISQFLQGMRNIIKHLLEISGTCIIWTFDFFRKSQCLVCKM